MQFNVPQFIDIEDKIVGPFTAKQLGWMGAAGVLLLIAWGLLDSSAFIVAAVIIVAIFGALAFYRPYKQPLIKFVLSSIGFVFRPKVYIWKRDYDSIEVKKTKPKPKEKLNVQRKTLDIKKVKEISKRLDA